MTKHLKHLRTDKYVNRETSNSAGTKCFYTGLSTSVQHEISGHLLKQGQSTPITLETIDSKIEANSVSSEMDIKMGAGSTKVTSSVQFTKSPSLGFISTSKGFNNTSKTRDIPSIQNSIRKGSLTSSYTSPTGSASSPISDKAANHHTTNGESLITQHYDTSTFDVTVESSHGLPEWGLYTIMALGSLVVMLLMILCGCAYVLKRKNVMTRGRKRISSFFKGYEAAKTHEERLYTLPNANTDPRRMFNSREDLSIKKDICISESVSRKEFMFEDFKNAKTLNEVDPDKANKIKSKNRSRLPAPPPKPVRVEGDLEDYIEMKTSLKRLKSPILQERDESPERHLTESGYIMTPPDVMQQTSISTSGGCKACYSAQGTDRINNLPHNCDYQTAQSIETLKTVFSALPGNIVVLNIDNPQNTLKSNKSFRNLPSAQSCFHDEGQTQVFSPTHAASPKFPRQHSTKAQQPALDQFGPVSYTSSNPGYGLISTRTNDAVHNINDQVLQLGHDNGSFNDFSDPPSDDSDHVQPDYTHRMRYKGFESDYSKASAVLVSSDSKSRPRSDENLSDEIYDELCPLDEDSSHTVSRLGQKEPSLKRPPCHQRASVDLK